MISIENITFSYPSGTIALRSINAVIINGESVALLGRNGAGKTTLAKHINALLLPKKGNVYVDNINTRNKSVNFASYVGYVFQNPDDQISESSISRELKLPSKSSWPNVLLKNEILTQTIEILGLVPFINSHPWSIPRSMRKFVTIASIVANNPDIIIFDEPTLCQDSNGLDRLIRLYVYLKELKKTIVTISHDMDFCSILCDRALVMSEGEITYDGVYRDLFYHKEILAESGLISPKLVDLGYSIGAKEPIMTEEEFISFLRSSITRKN